MSDADEAIVISRGSIATCALIRDLPLAYIGEMPAGRAKGLLHMLDRYRRLTHNASATRLALDDFRTCPLSAI
jgi:hypothetical protein